MTNDKLNQLTASVTAFADFAEFEACMLGGYTPTLRPHRGRTNSERAFDRKIIALRREVARRGFRVYVGGGQFAGTIPARKREAARTARTGY